MSFRTIVDAVAATLRNENNSSPEAMSDIQDLGLCVDTLKHALDDGADEEITKAVAESLFSLLAVANGANVPVISGFAVYHNKRYYGEQAQLTAEDFTECLNQWRSRKSNLAARTAAMKEEGELLSLEARKQNKDDSSK